MNKNSAPQREQLSLAVSLSHVPPPPPPPPPALLLCAKEYIPGGCNFALAARHVQKVENPRE